MKICSHSENQKLFWVCGLIKSVKSAKTGETSLSIVNYYLLIFSEIVQMNISRIKWQIFLVSYGELKLTDKLYIVFIKFSTHS